MIKSTYFAGGCFWGVQEYFSRLNGVVNTEVGYANGITDKTKYHSLKRTLHAETVKIDYDSNIISLEELIVHLFRIIHPDSLNKQGNDVGVQYRTGVYFTDSSDVKTIDSVFNIFKKNYKEFYVELEELKNYSVGEEYHQDYLKKNPTGYCHVNLDVDYNLTDKEKEIINQVRKEISLDDLSYSVLKHSATERPHTSELNKEHRKGEFMLKK